MGFVSGVGPRRCPSCRGWFDVVEVKMVKHRGRLYCTPCAKRLGLPNNFRKRATAVRR